MPVRTPAETLETASNAGLAKASGRTLPHLAIGSILAGAYIALGGALSIIIGYGFPQLSAANPGLQRLLSGLVFPVGLMLVVILGADLFTGNNALLVPPCMQRKLSVAAMMRNWTIVWLGNFVGALIVAYFLVYLTGLTASAPYAKAVEAIGIAKTSASPGTIFLKGIGANWCVCLAIWLALSAKSSGAKMFGCWLPVMAFVALGYEHSIANMFFIPCGMLEGAEVAPMQMITANLIPATLGNIAGGALLVGCVHTYLHLKKQK